MRSFSFVRTLKYARSVQFHTEVGTLESPPPPQKTWKVYSLILKNKICIVSYSCMTLWQCPTNFFPPPPKKSCVSPVYSIVSFVNNVHVHVYSPCIRSVILFSETMWNPHHVPLQWNPSKEDTLKWGHLNKQQDTFCWPKCHVYVQFNPLKSGHLTNQDTFFCPDWEVPLYSVLFCGCNASLTLVFTSQRWLK